MGEEEDEVDCLQADGSDERRCGTMDEDETRAVREISGRAEEWESGRGRVLCGRCVCVECGSLQQEQEAKLMHVSVSTKDRPVRHQRLLSPASHTLRTASSSPPAPLKSRITSSADIVTCLTPVLSLSFPAGTWWHRRGSSRRTWR